MPDTTRDLEKICTVLDKLTLDALTLMQEEIDLKLTAENAMIGGETHLAKTRYILGQNSVSSLQLPTENSPEFQAVTVLQSSEDESDTKQFGLESRKEKSVEPIKWFGFMPPQNLHLAQKLYQQALQWLVQAANVQLRLQETCENINKLKQLKGQYKKITE